MTFLTIYITHPNKSSAEDISSKLLEERLIACANIYPIESSYRWKGKIENETEWVSLLKTSLNLGDAVEGRVQELHTYEVPCIIRTEVIANKAYENWINEQVS